MAQRKTTLPAQKVEKVYGILEQPKTIEEWVFARKKNPDKFGYTPEGDLILSPTREGEEEKIFVIPKYTRTSVQQIRDFYKEKARQIEEPQEQFRNAKQNLRKTIVAFQNGQATAADVKNANQQTKDADSLLNSKYKYPLYYTINHSEMEYNLTFKNYDRVANLKFAEPVFEAGSTPFPWRALWTLASNAEPEVVAEEETIEEGKEDKDEAPKQPRKLTNAAIAIINSRRKAMGR